MPVAAVLVLLVEVAITIQIVHSKSNTGRNGATSSNNLNFHTELVFSFPWLWWAYPSLKLAKEATTLNFYFIIPINLARIRGGFWVVMLVVPIENDANWKNSNLSPQALVPLPSTKLFAAHPQEVLEMQVECGCGGQINTKHANFICQHICHMTDKLFRLQFFWFGRSQKQSILIPQKTSTRCTERPKNSILFQQPMCLDQQKNFTGARSWAAKHGPNSTKLTYVRFNCMCIFIVVL